MLLKKNTHNVHYFMHLKYNTKKRFTCFITPAKGIKGSRWLWISFTKQTAYLPESFIWHDWSQFLINQSKIEVIPPLTATLETCTLLQIINSKLVRSEKCVWVKIYRRRFLVKEQNMCGLWNIKYALYWNTVLVWCINLKANWWTGTPR